MDANKRRQTHRRHVRTDADRQKLLITPQLEGNWIAVGPEHGPCKRAVIQWSVASASVGRCAPLDKVTCIYMGVWTCSYCCYGCCYVCFSRLHNRGTLCLSALFRLY